jgi:hypothetical protein
MAIVTLIMNRLPILIMSLIEKIQLTWFMRVRVCFKVLYYYFTHYSITPHEFVWTCHKWNVITRCAICLFKICHPKNSL